MSARMIQKGDAIDYTPVAAVAAGAVVVQGNLVGVASVDIPANQLGALQLSGVFEMDKDTSDVTVGAKLYWAASDNEVSITGGTTNTVYVGLALEAAGTTVDKVKVRLG